MNLLKLIILDKPLISIITINLNNLKGLKNTMNSVFTQTYSGFEYIVIDGGSEDGSKEYIQENSNKISFWVSSEDGGIYCGMNIGIRAAKGSYILFLNSGDFFYHEKVLEETYPILTSHDLIFFNLELIKKQGAFLKTYPSNLSFSYFLTDSLPHPATFINTALFDQIGLYNEELKVVADWEFFLLAIFKYNCSYLRVDKILSCFKCDGISSDPGNRQIILDEKRKVLAKHFKAILPEIYELNDLKGKLWRFKSSKRNRILLKLGLIKAI